MRICSACGHENSERAKFCQECAAPLAVVPAAREQRRTVTVLFCDVTGSTALGETVDPERLRALLARYFERMKGIVELHGGTVEKFIGDAVMAVFGVPLSHEDDALRAVRAAVEMRDALPQLGLHARIGVNTGEVVTSADVFDDLDQFVERPIATPVFMRKPYETVGQLRRRGRQRAPGAGSVLGRDPLRGARRAAVTGIGET